MIQGLLFKNQDSQGTIADKFRVERKRFYSALMGKKHDVSKKLTKAEKAKCAMKSTKPKMETPSTGDALDHGEPSTENREIAKEEDMPEVISDDNSNNKPSRGTKRNLQPKNPKSHPPRK